MTTQGRYEFWSRIDSSNLTPDQKNEMQSKIIKKANPFKSYYTYNGDFEKDLNNYISQNQSNSRLSNAGTNYGRYNNMSMSDGLSNIRDKRNKKIFNNSESNSLFGN